MSWRNNFSQMAKSNNTIYYPELLSIFTSKIFSSIMHFFTPSGQFEIATKLKNNISQTKVLGKMLLYFVFLFSQ